MKDHRLRSRITSEGGNHAIGSQRLLAQVIVAHFGLRKHGKNAILHFCKFIKATKMRQQDPPESEGRPTATWKLVCRFQRGGGCVMHYCSTIAKWPMIVAVVAFATVASADEQMPSSVGTFSAEENVVETFDVPRDGDFLILPVQIEGRQYNFALGSSPGPISVDLALHARHVFESGELARDAQGFPKARYRLSGHIGKSRLAIDGPAEGDNLAAFRKKSGYDLYGELAVDFVKQQILQIDFETGKLHILRAIPRNPGTRIRVSFDEHGAPTIDGQLPTGESIAFRLVLSHSRFHCGTMARPVFRKLVDSVDMSVLADAGYAGTSGSLRMLRIGNIAEREVPFVEDNVRNVLGLGFLSMFHVVFDLGHGQMYLRPREKRPVRVIRGDCGLEIGRISEVTFIDSVDEDGSAKSAGLKSGDRLLKVDTINAAERTLLELRRVLFQRGNRVRLIVERDGELIEREIVAE
ncbi:MAG: hypothetical protein HY290_29480 [Planctomycetia bacterium]|nr:hypothetical protein [Planctomycetia bacterium]